MGNRHPTVVSGRAKAAPTGQAYSGVMPADDVIHILGTERRVSGVALTLITLFFALIFPYSSGLEIPRAGVQLFYSAAAPIYMDLAMSRWRAPWSGVIAWPVALAVQWVALAAVRAKVGHWVVPNGRFLFGAALLGLGVAVGFAYLGEFWSGSIARQVYMFVAIALFLFWRMTPEAIQVPVDEITFPDIMPWTGLFGGAAVAGLGWLIYGRKGAA